MTVPEVSEIDDQLEVDRIEQIAEEQGLSTEQAIAVEMLAYNYNNNEIAEELSVHVNTVSNWKNDDESFKMALKKRKSEVMKQFSSRLKKINFSALDMVEKGMELAEQEAKHGQDWKMYLDAAERITKILGSHGELMEEYRSDETSMTSLVDQLAQYLQGLSDSQLKGAITLMETTDDQTLQQLAEGDEAQSGDFANDGVEVVEEDSSE